MQKKRSRTTILVVNAMLIAIQVILARFAIDARVIKITFEHFPLIISGVAFGPINGMMVGALGELVDQILSKGFTLTTPLWILPLALRGLIIGLLAKWLHVRCSAKAIVQKKLPMQFILICVLTGIMATILNTAAWYVDTVVYQYNSPELTIIPTCWRVVSGIFASIMMGLLAKPILHALRRANLI